MIERAGHAAPGQDFDKISRCIEARSERALFESDLSPIAFMHESMLYMQPYKWYFTAF